MPAHAKDKPIEVWFQDEARVGQKGSLTHIWAERGSRPPRLRDQRHGSVWLFGAVCAARGVGAGLVTEGINAEAMSLHLEEISFHVAPDAHAVVVLDGAGWHQTGGRLRVPDNITLMPLPPYCPELNPVKMSGNISARTNSASPSGTTSTPSSMPVAPLGTNSSARQKPSPQSPPENGQTCQGIRRLV